MCVIMSYYNDCVVDISYRIITLYSSKVQNTYIIVYSAVTYLISVIILPANIEPGPSVVIL